MLRSIEKITGYTLQATDGEIGRCKDFLFDDEQWVVRYMVADTGKWIPDRKVLISPISLGEPDWSSGRFDVELSKEEIESAPRLAADEPVSRRYEAKYFRHRGYTPYWGGLGVWGLTTLPARLRDGAEEYHEEAGVATEELPPSGDPHLRSVNEVTGYHIRATDGDVGHVEDFVVDDETWMVRYVVVDTRNWLPGRKVILAPDWFRSFKWSSKIAEVDLTREQIESSPEYDPGQPINVEYEARLYDFYGRPVYWR